MIVVTVLAAGDLMSMPRCRELPERRCHRPSAEQSVDGAGLDGPGVDRQGPVRRLDRAVEVGVGVRGRDHERLSQDAAADHLLQEQRPERLRRVPLGVAGQEHQAARPAGDLDVLLEPGRGDLGVHRVRELAALALHLPDHVPLGVRLLHGEVRGQPGRLRAVGGGQQEDPRSLGAQATELHEVAAPGKGGDREAVAERLAPGRQVRRHAVDLLGAAGRPPHAGDHLVEDQDERRPRRRARAAPRGSRAPARPCPVAASRIRQAISPGYAASSARTESRSL